MTSALPSLEKLRPNAASAKLPLFDRSKWKPVRFGEVVQQLKEEVDPQSGDVDRYVAGEHMETENVHIRKWGVVGDGYLGPAFIRRFRKGQVLYGSRRTYLKKVAVAEWDGVTANTTFVMEAIRERLLPELLPWLMLSERFTKHSVAESKGSTNPYINFPDIAKFKFALPPLGQQRRIAEVLWAVDEGIQTRLSVMASTNSCLSAVLEAELDRLFKGSCAKLSELWAASPDSGCSAPPSTIETGHFVLSLTAVSANGYLAGNLKPVVPTAAMLSARLTKGDLLISRSNTQELVGFVGIFGDERNDVSFPDTMMRLHIDEKRIEKRFLEAVLLSKRGRSHMMRSAAGTSASMKKINRQTLGQCLIPTPTLFQQQKFLDRLVGLRGVLAEVDTAVATTESLMIALLNTIFP